jgi:hypothetical protein
LKAVKVRGGEDIAMDADRKLLVEDRHIATLSAFVLRARRVESHSLALDKVLLHKLSRMEMTYQFVASENQGYLIQVLPPEEQIESAAARVRPLLLQEEAVHYIKVLNALGYFAKESADEKLRNALAAIRSDWNRIKPRGKDILGASTQIEDADGNKSEFLSDTELAFAYIYGDVVHNDLDRIAATNMHGVKERFKAAAPIVGYIMVLTIATLNVTRNMMKAGLVELPNHLLTDEVVVAETVFRNEARAWSAPLGTPLPRDFGGPGESTQTAESAANTWHEQ